LGGMWGGRLRGPRRLAVQTMKSWSSWRVAWSSAFWTALCAAAIIVGRTSPLSEGTVFSFSGGRNYLDRGGCRWYEGMLEGMPMTLADRLFLVLVLGLLALVLWLYVVR